MSMPSETADVSLTEGQAPCMLQKARGLLVKRLIKSALLVFFRFV